MSILSRSCSFLPIVSIIGRKEQERRENAGRRLLRYDYDGFSVGLLYLFMVFLKEVHELFLSSFGQKFLISDKLL